jgi:hypothetical protein
MREHRLTTATAAAAYPLPALGGPVATGPSPACRLDLPGSPATAIPGPAAAPSVQLATETTS